MPRRPHLRPHRHHTVSDGGKRHRVGWCGSVFGEIGETVVWENGEAELRVPSRCGGIRRAEWTLNLGLPTWQVIELDDHAAPAAQHGECPPILQIFTFRVGEAHQATHFPSRREKYFVIPKGKQKTER
jgi:hypothetical protein